MCFTDRGSSTKGAYASPRGLGNGFTVEWELRQCLQTNVSGRLAASRASWLNLVPLTAHEGPGKTVSGCKMGCIMKREEGWAGIKLPSCCYLKTVTELHDSFLPQGTQVRRAIFL